MIQFSPESILHIKKLFYSMESTTDFSELLEYIRLQRENPTNKQKSTFTSNINVTYQNEDHSITSISSRSYQPITTDILEFYALPHPKRYHEFSIPKKSGGIRTITAPSESLKSIQRLINELLTIVFTPHFTATGFVPKKSIVENADLHIGKRYVYNIDLKDFFPSVSFERVLSVFSQYPFKLYNSSSSNHTSNRGTIGLLIAKLCCNNGCLPQGAPTSPTLTNIVCKSLDKKLYRLAKQHYAIYSRYADDITFSSNRPVFSGSFRTQLITIVEVKEKFAINFAKERLQTSKERQIVTGIVVNQKRNLERSFMKDIRFWLMCWERFGKVAAVQKFSIIRRGHGTLKNHKTKFENYLLGRILYFGMVRGNNDTLYRKFLSRFAKLSGNRAATRLNKKYSLHDQPNKLKCSEDLNKLLTILTTWEQEGIDKAQSLLL